MYESVSCRLFA